jgi:acyl carrier protein
MNTKLNLRRLLEDSLLLAPDEYTDDMKFSELESWDSLSTTVLAVNLSENLGVLIQTNDLIQIESAWQLKIYLENLGVEFE